MTKKVQKFQGLFSFKTEVSKCEKVLGDGSGEGSGEVMTEEW